MSASFDWDKLARDSGIPLDWGINQLYLNCLRKGKLENVVEMITLNCVNPNKHDMAAMVLAFANGCISSAKELKLMGSNLPLSKSTWMQMFIEKDKYEFIKFIMRYGPDILRETIDIKTASVIIKKMDLNLTISLFHAGADIHMYECLYFRSLCKMDKTDAVKKFIMCFIDYTKYDDIKYRYHNGTGYIFGSALNNVIGRDIHIFCTDNPDHEYIDYLLSRV